MSNSDETQTDAQPRDDAEARAVLRDIGRSVKYDSRTGTFVWVVPTPDADGYAVVVYDATTGDELERLGRDDALAAIEHYHPIERDAVENPGSTIERALDYALSEMPHDQALGVMYATHVTDVSERQPPRPTADDVPAEAADE